MGERMNKCLFRFWGKYRKEIKKIEITIFLFLPLFLFSTASTGTRKL
jgi:hypothetical protein